MEIALPVKMVTETLLSAAPVAASVTRPLTRPPATRPKLMLLVVPGDVTGIGVPVVTSHNPVQAMFWYS